MKMIDLDGAYLHTSYEENGLMWHLIGSESLPHSVKLFKLNRDELRSHILATTKDTFKSRKGDYVDHMRNTIDVNFKLGKIKIKSN